MIKYLSPSSIALYLEDKAQFYKRYCAGVPRTPQTHQMAIGSAFDSRIKSRLAVELSPEVEPVDYFTSEVEEQNRGRAAKDVEELVEFYVGCGGYGRLLSQTLGGSVSFENTVSGAPFGTPLLGKPDMHWFGPSHGVRVHDWKVNGIYSSASHKKGWLYRYTDTGGGTFGATSGDPFPPPLESIDSSWAIQGAVYSWLLGEPVGFTTPISIHQIVRCPAKKGEETGSLSLAIYSSPISKGWQEELRDKIVEMWDKISRSEILDEYEKLSECL